MACFGDLLGELRRDKNLKQKELAEILHLSSSSISAYETGRRDPPIEVLVQFARFFEVSVDYLLGLSGSKQPLSVLNREFAEGMSYGEVIEALQWLLPDYKKAISLTIESMNVSTNIMGLAKR